MLSHGHLDHVELAHLAGSDLPVALGAATHRILKAAAPFVSRPYQRVQIKRSGRFDLLEAHKTRRIYPEALADLAPRAALLFRPAMLRDLDRAECLNSAAAIWSQWDGYLDQPRRDDADMVGAVAGQLAGALYGASAIPERWLA